MVRFDEQLLLLYYQNLRKLILIQGYEFNLREKSPFPTFEELRDAKVAIALA